MKTSKLIIGSMALLMLAAVACQPEEPAAVNRIANPLVGYSWRLHTESGASPTIMVEEQVLTFISETVGELYRGWEAGEIAPWTDTTVAITYSFDVEKNTGTASTVGPYWIRPKTLLYNPSDETLSVDGSVFQKEY